MLLQRRSGSEKAVDIAFVIGASGAQASSVFSRMVAILKNFADEYEISDDKTRVSLVDYNGPAIARVFFNDGYSKANFTSFMSSIPGPGGQSGTLSGAFTKVRDEVFTTQNGERLSAENILVVLTPGNFDENSTEIQNEITNFRSSAVVIVFAITEEPGIDKWEKISSGINLIVIPEPSKDTEEAKKLLHAVNKVKEI
ncbi:von Willebrand factor A domain-containing protein 2 [Stylophora pistillata]|uniref:von Willebrand factor A domain-containing protein 2 n=1 Tax=Stylophora pistillata TaxID=50429 RepID=A0A2B4RHB7_STYPI|nr:von Willebrand factor A domain-containing protein 2 [Stylophora pistillata]